MYLCNIFTHKSITEEQVQILQESVKFIQHPINCIVQAFLVKQIWFYLHIHYMTVLQLQPSIYNVDSANAVVLL